MADRELVGRRKGRRPAAFLAVAFLLVAVSLYGVVRGGNEPVARGVIAVPNPAATEPLVSSARGMRVVLTEEAPQLIALDAIFPDRPTRLLWFQGRATAPYTNGKVIAVDGAGGLVSFDERLEPRLVRVELDGREVFSASVTSDGGLWIAAATGEFMRANPDGEVTLLREFSPFDYTQLASDAEGNAWAVRSAVRFSMRPESFDAPLVVRLDTEGGHADSVGSVTVPADFLLAQLANAGHIVVSDELIYFAPFIRDEVLALTKAGDTLWVSKRGLPQHTDEPRFEVENGQPLIDYAPVNLGLALGPDELLYALSVPGFTVEESRLDVFDPESGDLIRTGHLPTALPTLAVDEEGRVYLVDEFRLLTGVPPRERRELADFDLEVLGGGRMTKHDLSGKVTLINFWASWCEPCRVEMPALDSLRLSIEDPEFQFLSFNEDVNPEDGREFLDEFGFDFTVLLGRGRLRSTYHYMGLPFTVLADRAGKVVQRWIGFAGEDQIHAIRSVVTAELERGVGTHGVHDAEGHGEHAEEMRHGH